MVESIGELDQLIRDELDFGDDDMNLYIHFEEHENHFTVKYKRWLAPSMGGLKLKSFLVEKLGAKYEPYPKATFIIERGRVTGLPSGGESQPPEKELDSSLEETQPANPSFSAKNLEVPLSSLQHNVFNPRKKRSKLTDLLESIPTEGLREPIVVRPHPKNKIMSETRYQIISGHRRYEALKKLGCKKVPVIIRKMTNKEACIEAVKSNLGHGNRLVPFDEAKWIKEELIEKQGMTREEVAKEYNRTQQWVSNRLAMLEVPKSNVTNQFVSSTKAIEVAKAHEKDRQEIVNKVEREGLTVKDTHNVVGAIKEAPKKKDKVLKKLGAPKATRCGFPDCMKGAYYPTFYEGIPVCPDCDKKIKADPSLIKKLLVEPSVPERILKKTGDKIKPTWDELQAIMHPKVSKMEFEVIHELQAEGWPIDTEYWIPLTKPDGFLHDIRLPLEVDGEQVHRGKKAERDEVVNRILQHRGMEPIRERYNRYSIKRKEEIKASFRERMIQRYQETGLKLPSKVQEKMEMQQ